MRGRAMFPDEWDDYHEWRGAPARPTVRNAILGAVDGILQVCELLWAPLVAAAFALLTAFEAVGGLLAAARRRLDERIERMEEPEAWRRRMGLPAQRPF